MNKTCSTPNVDVESGLTTITDTLKLLDAMPSISKEGEKREKMKKKILIEKVVNEHLQNS